MKLWICYFAGLGSGILSTWAGLDLYLERNESAAVKGGIAVVLLVIPAAAHYTESDKLNG